MIMRSPIFCSHIPTLSSIAVIVHFKVFPPRPPCGETEAGPFKSPHSVASAANKCCGHSLKAHQSAFLVAFLLK